MLMYNMVSKYILKALVSDIIIDLLRIVFDTQCHYLRRIPGAVHGDAVHGWTAHLLPGDCVGPVCLPRPYHHLEGRSHV